MLKMTADGKVFVVGSDWQAPSKAGKLITGLMVNNSLTGGKTEFVPQARKRKRRG